MLLDMLTINNDNYYSLQLVKGKAICLVSYELDTFEENPTFLIPINFNLAKDDVEIKLVAIKLTCLSYIKPNTRYLESIYESDNNNTDLITIIKPNFDNIEQDVNNLLSLLNDPHLVELNKIVNKSFQSKKNLIIETLLKNIADYISK